MTSSPDTSVIPVFPLTGTLLLPGNFMPLNIFEERYCNMVSDVLEGQRVIGMIQPRVPGLDNLGPDPNGESQPEIYAVGCAGQIEECEHQPDGRFLIVLKGTRRFRVHQELTLRRGYRQVVAGFDEFAGDLRHEDTGLDRERLLAAVERFSKEHGLEFDPELLASLPVLNLLHALSAALPFEPIEKQALLEAPSPAERQEILLTLMGMGFEVLAAASGFEPPTVN